MNEEEDAMSVITDGHIIEPEGMFEHLRGVHLRRRSGPLAGGYGPGDFNGCWLTEKSVLTLAAVDAHHFLDRRSKIDVSLGRRLGKIWSSDLTG
jgi:hypothetical protein